MKLDFHNNDESRKNLLYSARLSSVKDVPPLLTKPRFLIKPVIIAWKTFASKDGTLIKTVLFSRASLISSPELNNNRGVIF